MTCRRRPHGVVVSTCDFESHSPGSNPGEATEAFLHLFFCFNRRAPNCRACIFCRGAAIMVPLELGPARLYCSRPLPACIAGLTETCVDLR